MTYPHLYISPLERCNLQCAMCYTKKTTERLTNEAILDFVDRYDQVNELQTITFCGGEVFLLKDFVPLVNRLSGQYFIQIITNGTLDRLAEINKPNQVNLIVSIDGLEAYHNQNRGQGRFTQSITFLEKAIKLGFHTEIFSIVTKENYSQIPKFEAYIKNRLGKEIAFTYHPRKPLAYLTKHPIANRPGKTTGFSWLDAKEMTELGKTRHVFPPPNLGCYQIALMSDGLIYGCCEGIRPLGTIHDKIETLSETLQQRISLAPGKAGCAEPDFVCGLPQEYVCH